MAKTIALVSLVKQEQQPVSKGGTHTQTQTYGSKNTYELTQAQHDTEIHSGFYSQLGRRGREKDGGQREGRDEKDGRGGQMERESGGRKRREEERREEGREGE